MLKLPSLFATSIIVTLTSWTGLAKASEKAVGFNLALPPVPQQVTQSLPETALPSQPVDIQALARYQETLPPLEKDSAKATPNQDTVEKTTTEKNAIEDSLVFLEASTLPSPGSPEQAEDTLGLSFDSVDEGFQAKVATLENQPSAEAELPETEQAEILAKATENAQGLEDWIFRGGADSLVARTVGSAEGTRHWSGARTPAYYGHTDPGNGVWNRGTFSYQHGAQSPEEADDKQLQRLKLQSLQLEEQAQAQGLELTLEEKLNGVDLANQAPLAALDRGGYIEQLAKTRRLNMEGTEAIVYARTWAYLDPDTRQWNAPGLGNTIQGIDRDQRRRAAAIAQAYQAYTQPGTQPLALSKLDKIHVVDTAAERSGLLAAPSEGILSKLQLPTRPTSPSARATLPAPAPQPIAETAALNPLPNSSERSELGVEFSATDDDVIMAAVDADTTVPEVISVPPIAESFAADTAAEPESSEAASEAASEVTSEPSSPGGEIAELAAPPTAPSQSKADGEAPQILLVPPVAPPIVYSAQDALENEPIRQRLWRLEDKTDDESADKAEPALPTGK